jgi:23S rRNA (guanosine2251-2'-O)-methyltransferase
MSVTKYEIRLCQDCGLRYPLLDNHPFGDRCPNCLGNTKLLSTHRIEREPASPTLEPNTRLEVLLDNVRSAWNVGSIFRTADGLGISKLYLCGITPTPENKSVTKTSLGAEKTVAWEDAHNALEKVKELKDKGCELIALEQDKRAIPLNEIQERFSDSQSIVLILGNEVTGVDPGLLDLCDRIIHIPMYGQKSSFNVEVAFAITAYKLLY